MKRLWAAHGEKAGDVDCTAGASFEEALGDERCATRHAKFFILFFARFFLPGGGRANCRIGGDVGELVREGPLCGTSLCTSTYKQRSSIADCGDDN